MAPHTPAASVVIRARDEAGPLASVLRGLARQRGPTHEVILVDSGSTDGTPEIARDHGAAVIEIEPSAFTFGHALNVGMAAARGRWLVSLSAHCPPLSDRWLEALVAPLAADARCAGVYGAQRGDPAVNAFEHAELLRSYGTSPRTQTSDPFFSNANAAIRASCWREVPFDEQASGSEDWLWAREQQRRGRIICYTPDAAVAHHHDEGLIVQARRRFREDIVALPIGPPRRPRRFRRGVALPMQAWLALELLAQVRRERIPLRQLSRGLQWHYAQYWGRWLAYRRLDRGR